MNSKAQTLNYDTQAVPGICPALAERERESESEREREQEPGCRAPKKGLQTKACLSECVS